MRGSVLSAVVSAVLCLEAALGFVHVGKPRMPPMQLADDEIVSLLDVSKSLTGTGTFEQYIDHENPDLGTFETAYWFNATYWKGPGSPIIFFTPGEIAASQYTGYLTDRTITGLYAKEVGGAVVMLEHRYWGTSTPFEVQSTKALQYLNLEQVIADFVRFAKTVDLPFDTNSSSNAPVAPWVWVGASYPGALPAWIDKLAPNTFWALHGSSGPVEAIYDYWQYFYPIQQGMPQNCSKDYSAIIEHVDAVLLNGTDAEKTALKEMFAVEDLEHDDDAASAISSPIWSWQSIQFSDGYTSFYQMCDAIEGAGSNSTGNYSVMGVGLDKALPNFAQWFTTDYLPGTCESYGYSDWTGEMNVQCFNTYNGSMEIFNDWSSDNAGDRPWVWMTCNQPFFYFQTGAPEGTPTVFTRLATPEYYERQCELYFPSEGSYTYGSALGKTAADVNNQTAGWFNTDTTRLLVSNGEFDPWRSASVSSVFRPGGPFNGTADAPVILIEGGRHGNDMLVRNQVHQSIKDAMDQELQIIGAWVEQFYAGNNTRRATRGVLGRGEAKIKLVAEPSE